MSRKNLQLIVICAVLALLVAAQFIFGGRKAEVAPPPARPAVPAEPEMPKPADPAGSTQRPMAAVMRIELGGTENGPDIVIFLGDEGWALEGEPPVAADARKVERLLEDLRNGAREPAADGGDFGIGPGRGYRVALVGEDGQDLAWEVGLRPGGVYDQAFIAAGDGTTALIHADIRGDLGLWENAPGATPAEGHWVERRIFPFDPGEVLMVSAVFPDHWVEFVRSGAEAPWTVMGHIPGGEWSREGLVAWLEKLAGFQAGERAGNAESAIHNDDEPLATITLTMAGGEEKSLTAVPDHNGAAYVFSSDRPDARFFLPAWRYRNYFSRLEDLFPRAAPVFDLGAIRFIDVRRGGENAKLAHRDGRWRAVAIPFPIRPARVDRLARYLAGWRPEDYATPGLKAIRPAYGGPMVEVTLDDGEVYQYRLAGRHPSLPWRYVVVNGYETFSIPDAEAAVMFPGFADILDLGLVLADERMTDLAGISVTLTYDESAGEEERLELLREGDDAWSVGGDGGSRVLTDEEFRRIVAGMFLWRVAGFQDGEGRDGDGPLCRITLAMANGSAREMTVFHPVGRDVPYRIGSDRGYLVERADFFAWYAAVGDVFEEFANARAERDRNVAEEERAAPREIPGDEAIPARELADEDDDFLNSPEPETPPGEKSHEQHDAPGELPDRPFIEERGSGDPEGDGETDIVPDDGEELEFRSGGEMEEDDATPVASPDDTLSPSEADDFSPAEQDAGEVAEMAADNAEISFERFADTEFPPDGDEATAAEFRIGVDDPEEPEPILFDVEAADPPGMGGDPSPSGGGDQEEYVDTEEADSMEPQE